jgi:hypothetical protein
MNSELLTYIGLTILVLILDAVNTPDRCHVGGGQ